MRAGKDYGKLTRSSVNEVLTMVRFGRFDEVLQVTTRPANEVQAGLWDFAMGYAHLKQGQPDRAEEYLERVKRLTATCTGAFRRHTAKHLLGIVAGILEGETCEWPVTPPARSRCSHARWSSRWRSRPRTGPCRSRPATGSAPPFRAETLRGRRTCYPG